MFKSVSDMVDVLFNIVHLILLLLILKYCYGERSRADRLEESNIRLVKRFVRFVMSVPQEYRIHLEDIESDKFDLQFPPHRTEDDSS